MVGKTIDNPGQAACFGMCILNNETKCDDCGRDHCVGKKCDDCINRCWELDPLKYELTQFWATLRDIKLSIKCDGPWQRIYKSGSSSTYDQLYDDGPLILKLILELSDGTRFTSYFDFVKLRTNNLLTVGNYIGGDAENFWNAPFEMIPESKLINSTCEDFYYNLANENNCSVSGLPVFEQQNYLNLTRGYKWDFCHQTLGPSTYVSDIIMEVTSPNTTHVDFNDLFSSLMKATC